MKSFYIKSRKELILWIAAGGLSFLVFLYVFSSVRFIVMSFDRILDPAYLTEEKTVRFDLEGLEKLKKAKGLM